MSLLKTTLIPSFSPQGRRGGDGPEVVFTPLLLEGEGINEKANPLGSSLEKTAKKIFWTLASWRIPKGPSGAFKPNSVSSVLILRPDRLGDFLLSAPAIRSLGKNLPSKVRFTLVAGERNEEAARALFPQTKVLVFKKPALQRLSLLFTLWRGRYDAVVDLHSYPFSTTSALMALLSGAPHRVGFWDNGGYKELSRKVFNFGAPPPGEGLHESAKSLVLVGKLVPAAGKAKAELLAFPPPPPQVRQAVKAFYADMALDKRTKLVAIHPTLLKEDNRWSQEKYLELVRLLGGLPNVKIVVVHGLGEQRELERFRSSLGAPPPVFVLPQDNILFILEAAKRFDRFVCNDSGLMHLAAGVTKVLAVFGPSEPSRWGPLAAGRLRHQVLRAKDHLCDSIEPREVAKAILKK